MKINEKVPFEVEYVFLEDRSLDEVINDSISPFDLAKAPLIRATLINLKDEEHILLLDMNHIISDGTSVTIIMTELINIINGNEALPVIKAQYKDYTVWKEKSENSEKMKKQEKYWMSIFSEGYTRIKFAY